MKILIGFLLALFISGQAYAQDSYKDILDYEIPEGTVSLCKEKHSSGYNWVNGEWVLTNFKPEELIVKKIPYKDIDKEAWGSDCAQIDDKVNNVTYVSRCYSIKKFGEEDTEYNTRLCTEEYLSDKKLNSIFCDFSWGDTMYFLPNGLFIRTFLLPNLKSNPKRDKKDSMTLSHGLCAIIN